MEKELLDIQDLSLSTADIIPGEGWPSTIHNAIMQLDNRIEQLKSVVIQHQQNFSVLAEEKENLQQPQSKDKLN